MMHMIRFTLKVFHLYLYMVYYGIIFMTMTTRRSVLWTKAKQVVTLSELI